MVELELWSVCECNHGWEPIFGSSLREAYYDIIDKVPNKDWKEFARTGLGIEEPVIDDICHDIPNNICEQKFQMCRKWGEMECVEDGEADAEHLEIVTTTKKYLYQILNHFLLGDAFPKPKRTKSQKHMRFMRNYCYRVGNIDILHYENVGATAKFLARYDTDNGSKEVVIFNNTFSHSTKFVPRRGTEYDVENMKNLWHKLGCKVIVNEDHTAVDMINKLKEYADSWRDLDYCIIIIMSHGDEGDVIYGESYLGEDFVSARDIVDIFSATNARFLAGTPKLFFFQCSRGGKVGENDLGLTTTKPVSRPQAIYEDPVDEMAFDVKRRPKPLKNRSRSFTIDSPAQENAPSPIVEHDCPSPDIQMPPLSDMLTCFSTTPGYSSFRDPRNGSWFINAVTNVFKTHASHQHVVSLMMKVGEAMSERTASEKNFEGQKCISHFECTLTKELYLKSSRTTPEQVLNESNTWAHNTTKYDTDIQTRRVVVLDKTTQTVGGDFQVPETANGIENARDEGPPSINHETALSPAIVGWRSPFLRSVAVLLISILVAWFYLPFEL